ncbi:hypothetical protein GALMADRAFT_247124 [Galerina marginata CBS 339.88]|uniref:Uncharacterized protein n=1 Tax=Galerina marginata (strain CBS 339.88) TaxID=685588 RepID=A0A067T0S6_GALM3|nr:hypothetical protein GALMADRAFT_247124 [Galerina marginata CBS 339.88]
MSSSTPRFLTSRSDYNDIVLFRHIRQSLAAVQTEIVEAFCTIAASKPGSEFHYLGLLWNCAFKAGIASMGAHSEPFTRPMPVAASSSLKTSVPPQSFTRDFSVLRSSCKKPFGSLRQRFRRSSQMQKQSAPVLAAPLQREKSDPPSDSFAPVPPLQSLLESSIELYSPETPSYQTPPTVLPDNPCSTICPSITSTSRDSRPSIRCPSWFSLKPKISRWIRSPSSSQPSDNFRTTFSRR